MRISVQPSTTPVAIPLYDGGVVMSLPVSSPVVYAARARADALIVVLSESGEAVTRAGGHVLGVPDLSDPIERQGVWDAMFALSLAEMQITGWDGIVDEDGKDLPFKAGNIVHLMRDARAADLYVSQAMAPYRKRETEKNV